MRLNYEIVNYAFQYNKTFDIKKENRKQEAVFLIYKKDILQAEVRRVRFTLAEELNTVWVRPLDEITFSKRRIRLKHPISSENMTSAIGISILYNPSFVFTFYLPATFFLPDYRSGYFRFNVRTPQDSMSEESGICKLGFLLRRK